MLPYVWDMMIDNEETWFITHNGCAMILSDCSLMDC